MKKLSSDPVTLFLRGILAVGRRARAERPPGSLSLSGLGILGSLNRLGPLVATRLAAQERLQPQSLTRLLAELERGRLITRTRSASDRREITIAMTAKGRKMLLADMMQRRAWLEVAMDRALTPQERRIVLTASTIMLKLAGHEDRPDKSPLQAPRKMHSKKTRKRVSRNRRAVR